jgi:RimJ/RimL family protein N-acetyltransferase
VNRDAALDGLLLRTPRLELRPVGDDDLRELLATAHDGVHPPAEMPFAVPWTDTLGTPEGDASFVDFHRVARASIGPDEWRLLFCVRTDGAAAGVQGIDAERFAETRIVATGSWLGTAYQRRGLGTEMRAAVLELAFSVLGAERATSGAIDGNVASRRVSEKLGYHVVGRSTVAPRGVDVGHTDLELTRGDWESGRTIPVDVQGAGPELRKLLGAQM